MKKFFLIISVVLGAVIPSGKASANPTCTNTYVDGSTETSTVNSWGYSESFLSCKCRNSSNEKIKNSVCTYQNIKSEREFDTNGNETKYIFSNCSGGTCNITETKDYKRTYDENGNQTEFSYERKDGDGNMLDYGSAQYEYDADDNLISSNYNDYYVNGQLMASEQETYVYDDDGNEIHSEYANKNYYKSGQISYDEYEEWDEVTGLKEFEKSYYENGQLRYESENYYYPDGTWTQDNMYYEYDDDGKLLSRTNEICNDDGCSSVSYDANGDLLSVNGNEVTENCASADSNGVCTKCKDGFDDIDGYCNKIRWTPAEAAKVLRDDNTNEVTITFKK